MNNNNRCEIFTPAIIVGQAHRLPSKWLAGGAPALQLLSQKERRCELDQDRPWRRNRWRLLDFGERKIASRVIEMDEWPDESDRALCADDVDLRREKLQL